MDENLEHMKQQARRTEETNLLTRKQLGLTM
jgi:hypothetical protein